jgi:DNA repair protein RadD
MTIRARDYQAAAVESLWTYFGSHPVGNPVIAMPTGCGKSVVQALFLESIFRQFPKQRVLCLTHVKELLEQNYAKLKTLWPNAPAGIYSAGLRRKDTQQQITFAGVASIAKVISQFGHVDLVIIDEAHLLSAKEESLYQQIIAMLKAVNPGLRVIGMTATPWRAGMGSITQGGIFTDVCFDMTGMAAFNWLIKQGYLAPLIPRQTAQLLDISGVHKLGGEFKANELQLAVDKDHITLAALQECIASGQDRKCWLVFASGVEHAINITNMLNYLGIEARCVHSKMPEKQRDKNIADWKAGVYTAIVNNGILTTGIDHNLIDLIIMLRPTASTVLWIQMLGRGTRPVYEIGYDLNLVEGRLAAIQASDKHNCLVLDFAGNTGRLGCINDPVIPRAKGQGTGEAPIRICEICNMYNHASARFCGGHPEPTDEGCGHAFTFTTKLKAIASTNEIIKNDLPITEIYRVDSVTYTSHNKAGKPPSLRVSYFCGLKKFMEFVHFELPGWGQRKAQAWWIERTDMPLPPTTAIAEHQASKLRVPTRVNVWVNKPYPEIMAVSFNPEVNGEF